MKFENKTIVIVNVAAASPPGPTSDHLRLSEHIGAVCALDLARDRANLVLVDSNLEAMRELQPQIIALGSTVLLIQEDPADAQAMVRAASKCAQHHPSVHVLIGTHYDLELASIESSTVESWERVVRFNLLGPVFAAKAFLPLLKRAGGAAIVNVGSIDGILGNPQIPSYSAAKGGLIPLTHLMADEFAPHNIRANCVARGMMTRQGAEIATMFVPLIAQTPIARPAYPHEVVNAVRFLASPEASYVNGVTLPVDGGRSGITQGTRLQRPAV
jgi:NAD(P)-dependent dehydrogenase (short-subunit alcohol dehydrogenase family)